VGHSDEDRTGSGAADPLVGAVLDRRYRIEYRLAAGGFGSIYRALHVITGRPVALKLLHAKLATEPDVVARFRREAAALAQLRSQHTITAYDFGQTSDGMLYIVMELLQGETMWERFEALGPFPWRKLVGIMRQVCSSLAEAHALGIVHRDLKPTNIHLEPVSGNPDFVKVLDFGIAKILHGSSLDNSDLTKSGTVVGTFDYMAPEQMVGAATTGQSDIYTLGIVMYEMLTGERAFGQPETPAAMLTAMLATVPRSVSNFCDAPPELDDIIMRCLDKEPSRRYRDVLELADALDQVLAIDDGKTEIGAPMVRMSDEMAAAPDGMAEDSLTWIKGSPERSERVDPAPVPQPIPATPSRPVQQPMTTLPGIGAASALWPSTGGADPRKKR
jgi:serine/threonine-protein kinase